MFENNRDEYYRIYLADERPDRFAQTDAMSVGSAFDAEVKSYLYERLVGKDPRFERDTIFEAQVEPHNRDFADAAGKHCFKVYQESGALADLMMELSKGVGLPSFEFEIKGTLGLDIGIPLLGKPDVFFISETGARIIYDWKVNGYCGSRNTSPKKGYVKIRPGGGMHKSVQLMKHAGIMIDISCCLEDIDTEWADQLAIYLWLTGETIGSQQAVIGIDQLACDGSYRPPNIRIASLRTRVSESYQLALKGRLESMWSILKSEWIFRDLSEEDSKARQALFDRNPLKGDGSTNDKWLGEVCR